MSCYRPPLDKLRITWDVLSWCNWASLILLLAGVGIFGQYMVLKFSQSPRTIKKPLKFVRVGRLKLALLVFGSGMVLQMAVILLANIVPGHL